MGNKNNQTIYFAGAIRGDRVAAEVMREVISWLNVKNIKVLTEHIADNLVADKLMPALEIESRDIEWLDQATHVIAEISGASTGTGREIEYARVKDKFGKIPAKILCIYQVDREFYASPMVRGMANEKYPNVFVDSYENITEAKEIIKLFLQIE